MLRSDGSHPWPLEDRVAHLAKVAAGQVLPEEIRGGTVFSEELY